MNFIIDSPNCDAFVAVVWYTEHKKAVRETHNAQSDFAVCLGDFGGLGNGIMAGVDDVIEESHAQFRCFGQAGPVDFCFVGYEFREVDTA